MESNQLLLNHGNVLFDHSKLNSEQSHFVTHNDDLSFLNGSPGVGKTLCILYKLQYNIVVRGIDPRKILVTSFSKRTVLKLQNDISTVLPDFADKIHVTTFHSFCWHLLHDHAESFGFKFDHNENKFIDIYDDFSAFINNIPLVKESLKRKEKAELIDYLLSCYANGETPTTEGSGINIDFQLLQEEIRRRNYNDKELTFQNLIQIVHDKINDDLSFCEMIARKYELIIADEMQDFTKGLHTILLNLYTINKRLVLVGDIKQTLYEFLYVDTDFLKEIINTATNFHLTRNYRSTQEIINVLNVIFPQTIPLVSAHNKRGPRPTCHIFNTIELEAQWIAQLVVNLLDEGFRPSDIAILFRFNEGYLQSRLPYILAGRGIACEVMRPFNEHFIHDPMFILAEAFLEMVNGSRNSKHFAQLLPLAIREPNSEFTFDDPIPYDRIHDLIGDKHHENYEYFYEILVEAQNNPDDALSLFKEGFDLCDNFPDYPARVENMKFLLTLPADTALHTLKMNAQGETLKLVHMGTQHGSKGCEWPIVFIPQLVNGTLPCSKSIREGMIESELRVFYVATSRAAERLHLSFSTERSDKSQFLNEEIMTHVDVINAT